MISILVVDDDAVSRHVVEQALHEAGLNPIVTSSGAQALEWLETHTPTVVLLDLMMPAPDGFTVLERIRQNPRLADTPVVVLTGLDADHEIARVFAAGADDYVHKPFRPAELVARIRGQMRVREYLDRLNQRERDQETVLELTQTLASTLDIRDILFTVVQRVAAFAKVDRCSIVLFGESGNVGYVLATSDDAMLRDLPIELAKYPEIREVLTTGRALVIRDGTEHPLLRVVRQDGPNIGFNSFALLPILHEHGAMGVLFLRSKGKSAFDDYELSLVTTLDQRHGDRAAQRAHLAIAARRDRKEPLATRRSRAPSAAVPALRGFLRERRRRHGGHRPRGQSTIREPPRAGDHRLQRDRADGACASKNSLSPLERDRAARLLRGFLDGIYPRGVDIAITDKSAEERTISVSFSSVLHEDNAVVFSFRDVTKERATAVELKQTKEFLESVIDSSVDGIVSANLRGTVLLFNRAAARIFGYSPSDVVGKMHVGKLYPPGGAHDIMRKIRDPNTSGYGRLEDHRVEMLNADGEPMQVQLSASLVIDNGRPIGSVGIFTDIRDKLRMEARLSMAQEELRSREKQAIVAELAGAAAHELNQPLTSVIGYAELLRRKLADHPQLSHAASVIVGESERMAEIVRKVGKITKYETKSYVGAAKILDLEKASENEGGDLPR